MDWCCPRAEGAGVAAELAEPHAGARHVAASPPAHCHRDGRGHFSLGEYATVSEHLLGLTWGAEDLSAAVGAATARTADGRFTAPYEMARSLTLFAAHAAQVAAIETVYPAFRDSDGLSRYVANGARDGFSGMMAIHPSQVSIYQCCLYSIGRGRRACASCRGGVR
jgi:citrate lyase subunit beta/citryl-CoA lyase